MKPSSHALHACIPVLTITALLEDPDAPAIISKHTGRFLLMADMSMAGNMTLEQVAANHPNFVSQKLLVQIEKELENIK